MPRSKAQAKAAIAWDKANMRSLTIKLRRTKVEAIAALAQKQGVSRDAWVKAAIDEKLEKEVMMQEKQTPSRWVHGKDNWKKWAGGVFAQSTGFGSMDSFCLGDRMVAWDHGSYHMSSLRGSYSDDWHGGPDFGCDLKAAIEWLQAANHKELEAYLWGGKMPEVVEVGCE